MIGYLEWFVIAFPVLGTLLNGFAGQRFSRRVQNWVALGGAVGALVALLPLCVSQVLSPGLAAQSRALPWGRIWDGMLYIEGALRLYIDGLSVWTALVVVGLGLWGMTRAVLDRPASGGRPRWLSLAWIDGLIAAVLLVVLADNLWAVFLGWSLAGWCLYGLIGQERAPDGWLLWSIAADAVFLLALGQLAQSFAHLSVDVLSVPPLRARLPGLLPYESTLPAAQPLLIWAMLSRFGLLVPAARTARSYERRTAFLFAGLIALPGCVVWLRRLSPVLFPLVWWQAVIVFVPAGLVWLLVQEHAQLDAAGRFLVGLEARVARATMERLAGWLLGK